MFVYAACAYGAGLLIVHLLVPRIVAADGAATGPVAVH
jgi:hypothetical protein